MDNRYIHLEWRPELERPALISAFTGWNDAAEAASVALGTLSDAWEARRFGAFDAEEFFDYQATRPQIKLVEGVTRRVEWPQNSLSATVSSMEAAGGRGVVLLSGPEPNFRWRSFCAAVIELARELGVEVVVTMGALLADVPHSRPVAVAANSQDPTLVESLGLSASRYEGPTGITGLLGMQVDTSNLERGAAAYQEQVSAAVSQDSDLSSYVRMLEERFDSQVEQGARDLPSGDELARELESFLRDQRREEE